MNKRLITMLVAGLLMVGFASQAMAETLTYVGSSTVGKFVKDAASVRKVAVDGQAVVMKNFVGTGMDIPLP